MTQGRKNAEAPIVFGLDDHIERRRGAKIAARGIYRDAVRSSKSFFVKTSGLRWVCMMLLATGTAAVWYHSGMPTVPLRWVLIAAPVDTDPTQAMATQALLCTDSSIAAPQIVEWFVLRWQVEVTFEETRAHLGIETQRQWSDLAILRTTPALLGLFSLVTLFAHHLLQGQQPTTRQAAWYTKELPTFADTLAYVRQHLWPVDIFWIIWLSPNDTDLVQIPKALFARLTDTLAFAT